MSLQSTRANVECELTKATATSMDFIHRKNSFLCCLLWLCVQALSFGLMNPLLALSSLALSGFFFILIFFVAFKAQLCWLMMFILFGM